MRSPSAQAQVCKNLDELIGWPDGKNAIMPHMNLNDWDLARIMHNQ